MRFCIQPIKFSMGAFLALCFLQLWIGNDSTICVCCCVVWCWVFGFSCCRQHTYFICCSRLFLSRVAQIFQLKMPSICHAWSLRRFTTILHYFRYSRCNQLHFHLLCIVFFCSIVCINIYTGDMDGMPSVANMLLRSEQRLTWREIRGLREYR